MGVTATKYITLPNRYAGYNDDDNFIQPHVIGMMLFDELKLPRIEEFVKEASITITEDEIKEFIGKKMDEEQPGLKALFESEMEITGEITGNEEVDKKNRWEGMRILLGSPRYYFEPYSLQYFKTYTSILKEKLQTLFSVLNDINKCKSEKLSEESEYRLKNLDFHINSNGNIYFKDAERLAIAIIDNVKDLCEKVNAGNNPETYLTFKESKHSLMKDDIWSSEIYPRKEIQIKDRYYAHRSGFIALSEEQQTQVQKESIENFSRWMARVSEESDYEDEKNISDKTLQLVKTEKNCEK